MGDSRLPDINDDKALNFDVSLGSKERFRSNAPAQNKQESLIET